MASVSHNTSLEFSDAQFLDLARQTLEFASDNIFWTNRDGMIVYANRSACSMLEYTQEELTRLHVSDFVVNFPPECWSAHWDGMIKTGRVVFEAAQRSKGGRVFPVEVSSNIIAYNGIQFGCAIVHDISQRIRKEQELIEARHQFETIFNESPAAVAITRIEDGTYHLVNRAFEQITGYSREEAIGKTSVELGILAPEDRARAVREIREKGSLQNLELPVTRKDGTKSRLLFSGAVVTYLGEQCMITLAPDITEISRTKDSFRESEARLRTFIDSSFDVIFILDTSGNFRFVSPSWGRHFGYPAEEVTGKPFAPYVNPDDISPCLAHLSEVMTSGVPATSPPYRVRCADGTYKTFIANGTRFIDANGAMLYHGIGRDITRQQQAEQELRDSELKFRTLFNTFQDLIYLTTADEGRIIECNDSLSGYSREELVGHTTTELRLWANPEDRNQVIELVKARGFVKDFHAMFRKKDGSFFPGSISTKPVTLNGTTLLFSVARDISEHIQLRYEREKAQRLESLGVLAGGIAHDFNNILTGILGNLSYSRRLLSAEHRASECLAECEKAAFRASELTRQLLTFARGGEPTKKPVNTVTLLEESLSFALRGSGTQYELSCPDDLWWINADAGQINQAIHNLLLNAAQAMGKTGTVRVTACNCPVGTTPAVLAAAGHVRIDVKDDGVGIPPENLPHIFDPYFTTKEHGTGLGLSSVYSIVQRHGGVTDVASTPGVGTVFSIYLPSAESHGESEDRSGPIVTKPAGQGRILIMDDEEMIRTLGEMILSEEGYTVECCSSGAEALDRHRQAREQGTPYDAIILDLTVPGGMGGKEVAEQIRSVDSRTSLIVSSGYSEDPVMARHEQYGFNGSVSKPYTVDNICGEVARVLQKQREGHAAS